MSAEHTPVLSLNSREKGQNLDPSETRETTQYAFVIPMNAVWPFNKSRGTQKNQQFRFTAWGQRGFLKLVHPSLPRHARFSPLYLTSSPKGTRLWGHVAWTTRTRTDS